MESFYKHNGGVPENLPPKQEDVSTSSRETKEDTIEFVPKFNHIQEDLKAMFTIEVADERSLFSPQTKDLMYAKVVEDLKLNSPYALDYMFEEELNKKKLLTREELQERGIQHMKPEALQILQTTTGTWQRTRAKNLFIDTGILTPEEANDAIYLTKTK